MLRSMYDAPVSTTRIAEPSQADKVLTRKLKAALALVDIRVLDHIVVAAQESVSFAECGLL